jgi:hypothetical protein
MSKLVSKELERLATKHVGDPKSNLVFVSDDDGVIAVFTQAFLRDAERLADSFSTPCWVETKHGVEHDNAASLRRQAAEED